MTALASELPVLFRQPGLPVFQNRVYSDPRAAKAAVTGDVELVQCPESGLVCNRLFDPSLVAYDESYENEQGLSPAFQRHLDKVLALVRMHVRPDQLALEIGCGKGFFLERMVASGLHAIGYDSTYAGESPNVHRRYYDPRKENYAPDLLILRHVLEHIANPWAFLEDLRDGVDSDCLIYIEVPCFEWIVENEAFFDIFYEHCNYFTQQVLTRAFEDVVESGHLFGDQYLYVVARLASFKRPSGMSETYRPLDFSDYKARVLARLPLSRVTYVWGAGAKGVTLANVLSRDGFPVEALVDINPAKQGSYIGLSGLKVLPPESLTSVKRSLNVLVMNPVYLSEIRDALRDLDVNIVTTDR